MEFYKNLSLEDIVYYCELDLVWKTEKWLNVLGFDGYMISDIGRIKSLPKNICSAVSDTGFRTTKQKVLKQRKDRDSYLQVNLRRNKKQFTFKVHRLVAINFIPNPENKPEVNHKNFITTCNMKTNLEWNTAKENTNHRLKRYFKNKISCKEQT